MRWLLVALVALMSSACDIVWRLDDLRPLDDGGSGTDGSGSGSDGGSDEPPAFCVDAYVFDDMSGGSGCGTWGASSGLVGRQAGLLEASVSGSSAMFSGCTAFGPHPALTPNGVFAEVTTVLEVPSGYTKLEVRNAVGVQPAMSASLHFEGTLRFFLNSALVAQFAVPPPRYWRLRATTGGILAETSDDGVNFTTVESVMVTMPPQIAVDLGAGVSQVSGPGRAQFSAFGICK